MLAAPSPLLVSPPSTVQQYALLHSQPGVCGSAHVGGLLHGSLRRYAAMRAPLSPLGAVFMRAPSAPTLKRKCVL
jgi:hypothetical protein